MGRPQDSSSFTFLEDAGGLLIILRIRAGWTPDEGREALMNQAEAARRVGGRGRSPGLRECQALGKGGRAKLGARVTS